MNRLGPGNESANAPTQRRSLAIMLPRSRSLLASAALLLCGADSAAANACPIIPNNLPNQPPTSYSRWRYRAPTLYRLYFCLCGPHYTVESYPPAYVSPEESDKKPASQPAQPSTPASQPAQPPVRRRPATGPTITADAGSVRPIEPVVSPLTTQSV